MSLQLPERVEIEYRYKNTMHIFTSVGADGVIHIDSTDRQIAFDRIAPVLSKHFSVLSGTEVNYCANLSYEAFCRELRGGQSTANHNFAFVLETQEVRC